MDVVKRIPQAVVNHRVDQLGVAHPCAEASRRQQIRSARHVLHAARYDDVHVACADHLEAIATALRPDPQTMLIVVAGADSSRIRRRWRPDVPGSARARP